MNSAPYEKLFATINQNPDYYRDQLRLGGVLYKHGSPGIDILPCSLTPYPIKAENLQLLREAQPLWQKLLYLVSQNRQLVNQIFKSTAVHDPFVRGYLKLYNQTHNYKQNIQFSIIRCDYLKDGLTGRWGLVEFNTLAVANGAMTQRLQKVMHRLYHSGPLKGFIDKENVDFPQNLQFQETLALMNRAFNLYGNSGALILIIGQTGQKNIYDHRYVGDYFAERGINFVMLSLDQAVEGVKCQNEKVFYEGEEVAILYFRGGASLKEYREETWEFRKNIQLTKAIKMPTVPLQLINFKRAQLELSKVQLMSKYLTKSQVSTLIQTITPGLDFDQVENFPHFIQNLNWSQYVLKPNKQGGGNNIYGEEILSTLKSVGQEGAKLYVLMNKIPADVKRAVQCRLGSIELIESTTEFGQIGGILIKDGEILEQSVGGVLVRTKPALANEGGIAKGYGGIDTLLIEGRS